MMILSYSSKSIVFLIICITLFSHSSECYAPSINAKLPDNSCTFVRTIKKSSIPQIMVMNQRIVLFQQPLSSKPNEGYPVLFLLHGASQYPFAWFIPINLWNYHQSFFRENALASGFFIISPSSGRPMTPGPHAWSSYISNISDSKDLQLFLNLFQWMHNQSDLLNLNQVYCAGFSSGGFMTSRLAKVFPERFAGMVIHSGTDADSITFSNKGPEFDYDSPLKFPINHPPTLIVHGETDKIVPFSCGLHLYHEMQENNINCTLLSDEQKGHVWISSFSDEILQWLQN